MLKAGEGGNVSWDGGIDGKGDITLAFLPFFHIYGTFEEPMTKGSKTDTALRAHLFDTPKPIQRLDIGCDAQV